MKNIIPDKKYKKDKLMKIKYTLGAACLIALTSNCSLDVNMYDGVMAEQLDPRNLPEVSNGSYRLLKNDGGLIDNGYYFWNYGADDLAWNGTSTDGNFKIYDYTRSLTDSRVEYTWELGYRTIGNCNYVIEMCKSLGDKITEEETVLMGENYYLRALCYFLLVNEFSQPYSNNPETNPGVPLKLTSDPEDLPKDRSTVAKVYGQVVADLKDAITYMTLPEGVKPKNNNYATKEAAEALLARVYLYMGEHDLAYTMADNVINSGRFELEKGERYATYPQIVPEENKETIFAVRRTMDKDDDGYGRPGGMFINIDNNGWEEVSASSRYLELLELHLNANDMPMDLRSRFIVKRYVENGSDDVTPANDPNKVYKKWSFAYAVKSDSEKNKGYKYVQLSVEKKNGEFVITGDNATEFEGGKIQHEDYNLGTRYFVKDKNGNKYIGRIEPLVFDAATKTGKDAQFLVYAINKCSYQEQRRHAWSPIISRLAEMYLIRAEVNAVKGNAQEVLDDVNELRKRAGIPEWTLENIKTAEAGQPKDLMKIVEEERMLEFAWEGHRRFDVFRWKHTMDRKYPGGHTMQAGDKFLEIPYNSPAVCSFIPKAQYDAYPYELEQNP